MKQKHFKIITHAYEIILLLHNTRAKEEQRVKSFHGMAWHGFCTLHAFNRKIIIVPKNFKSGKYKLETQKEL